MTARVLLLIAATATTAHAGEGLSADATAAPSRPHVGVMLDAGLPDGAMASIVARPIRALRIEAGIGDDGVGPGVRGGVTWIPLRSWATPTLGAAYGRFFERDANPLVREVTGDMAFASPLLQRFGYDFAVARVGLELGHEHATFFIHAGATRITGQIHGLASESNMAAAKTGSSVTVTSSDPDIEVWTASADVGFIVYFH